jgi:SHS2 domain-containing protein
MGFEELQHTADWALRVWAPDLPSLLTEAARGMNALSGAVLSKAPRLKRQFEAQAEDPESLLVAFLSELVYYAEQESTVFDRFEARVNGSKLIVQMKGAPLLELSKPIKAVTYHNLEIQRTRRGLEAEIVFDV